MIMSIKKDLEVPRVPNYILVAGEGGEKVRLADLEPGQLAALADEWKYALLRRATEQRSDPKLNPILGTAA